MPRRGPEKWQIVPLDSKHDRTGFDCGNPTMNEWLIKYARQSHDLGIAQTFVLVAKGQRVVKGYFAIRAGQAEFSVIPPELRKRLPKYPIPVVHLARLAVDRSLHRQGFGGDLLIAALEKAVLVSSKLGANGIEVFAIDDAARSFYSHYGFHALADDKRHLYLPMSAARNLLGSEATKPCPRCGEPMVFEGIDALDNYAWLCKKCDQGLMGHLTI